MLEKLAKNTYKTHQIAKLETQTYYYRDSSGSYDFVKETQQFVPGSDYSKKEKEILYYSGGYMENCFLETTDLLVDSGITQSTHSVYVRTSESLESMEVTANNNSYFNFRDDSILSRMNRFDNPNWDLFTIKDEILFNGTSYYVDNTFNFKSEGSLGFKIRINSKNDSIFDNFRVYQINIKIPAKTAKKR